MRRCGDAGERCATASARERGGACGASAAAASPARPSPRAPAVPVVALGVVREGCVHGGHQVWPVAEPEHLGCARRPQPRQVHGPGPGHLNARMSAQPSGGVAGTRACEGGRAGGGRGRGGCLGLGRGREAGGTDWLAPRPHTGRPAGPLPAVRPARRLRAQPGRARRACLRSMSSVGSSLCLRATQKRATLASKASPGYASTLRGAGREGRRGARGASGRACGRAGVAKGRGPTRAPSAAARVPAVRRAAPRLRSRPSRAHAAMTCATVAAAAAMAQAATQAEVHGAPEAERARSPPDERACSAPRASAGALRVARHGGQAWLAAPGSDCKLTLY